MQFLKVEFVEDLSAGDIIILTGDMYDRQSFKIPMIKVTEADGTEVIINTRKNHYFNLGMYLDGKSWVKELYKVVP